MDVVVVGSLNMDLVTRVRRHPRPGETVAASEMHTSSGGKGANQASAAGRLGAQVAIVGRVGADAHGDQLLAGLRADGVDVSQVHRDAQEPTGTAFITVSEEGENSIVVVGGANQAMTEQDIAEADFADTRVVTLVLEVPIPVVLAAARAASTAGARVVMNLSPVLELPQDVFATMDPLVVNEHEAREILKERNVEFGEKWSEADSAKLRDLGPSSVVVTLGADGASYADESSSGRVPAEKVTVQDTTGAGDAFTAALAWRLSQGDALADAVSWGTRVSGYAVQHDGAQASYPQLADLEG